MKLTLDREVHRHVVISETTAGINTNFAIKIPYWKV